MINENLLTGEHSTGGYPDSPLRSEVQKVTYGTEPQFFDSMGGHIFEIDGTDIIKLKDPSHLEAFGTKEMWGAYYMKTREGEKFRPIVENLTFDTSQKIGFASDQHIHATNFTNQDYANLQSLLDSYDVIVINGDLFDGWVDDISKTANYLKVCDMFQKAIDLGKEIVYVYGNHDSESEWKNDTKNLATNEKASKIVKFNQEHFKGKNGRIGRLVPHLPVTYACHQANILYGDEEKGYIPFKVIHGDSYKEGLGDSELTIIGKILTQIYPLQQLGISLGEGIVSVEELRKRFGSKVTLPEEAEDLVVERDGKYGIDRKYLVMMGHSHQARAQIGDIGVLNDGDMLPENPLIELFALMNNRFLFRTETYLEDGRIFMKRGLKQKIPEGLAIKQNTNPIELISAYKHNEIILAKALQDLLTHPFVMNQIYDRLQPSKEEASEKTWGETFSNLREVRQQFISALKIVKEIVKLPEALEYVTYLSKRYERPEILSLFTYFTGGNSTLISSEEKPNRWSVEAEA